MTSIFKHATRSWVLVSVAMVAGCAAPPEPDGRDGLSVRDIVMAVQCEFAAGQAASLYPATLDSFKAGVKLELRVTNQVIETTGLTASVPVVADTLVFDLGFINDESSYRYTTVGFEIDMAELRKKFVRRAKGKDASSEPPRLIEACYGRPSGFRYAESGLGLAAWLSEAVNSVAGTTDASELTDMSYLLQFTVVRDGSGKIGFKSSRVDDSVLRFARKDTRDNMLNVTVSKKADVATGDGATAAQRDRQTLQNRLQQNRFNSLTTRGVPILLTQ